LLAKQVTVKYYNSRSLNKVTVIYYSSQIVVEILHKLLVKLKLSINCN
jgi:hypothetical protein